MEQRERRLYLIRRLLAEQPSCREKAIPQDEIQQKQLLRALMNLRPPREASEEFLSVQDAYLQAELLQKGVTKIQDLKPVREGMYLWQGDITTLRCGAIVNAANSGMTGCYVPLHGCIDNCIHSAAGVQLRLCCQRLIEAQGHEEPVGCAKLTPAFNLPCRYVLHTVGPAVRQEATEQDEQLLARCYRSCLKLAEEHEIRSIAFCCISTGVFRFPNRRAAEIAIQTVQEYRKQADRPVEVIWNVFKDEDCAIYRQLLQGDIAAERGGC